MQVLSLKRGRLSLILVSQARFLALKVQLEEQEADELPSSREESPPKL
ncbi:hypothetical protein LSH36_143g05053 [Paralvinella palmiformis]|uniref:Uncharacterized protein n=1 Tax=Paralvinella palmiformis TaxID=53620 RepID=A0AAD9JV70_9ANNE|nr:hypothetical protein LSH36_143g05053 [Paralvinella palmiformis]